VVLQATEAIPTAHVKAVRWQDFAAKGTTEAFRLPSLSDLQPVSCPGMIGHCFIPGVATLEKDCEEWVMLPE
jgi:hypothetical protein